MEKWWRQLLTLRCPQFTGGEHKNGKGKQEALNDASKVPWPPPWGRWEGTPGAVTSQVWLEGYVEAWHFIQETEYVLDRRQKLMVLRSSWACHYAWNTNSWQHLEEWWRTSLGRKAGLGSEDLCWLHEEFGLLMQETDICWLAFWKHRSGICVEDGLVDGWRSRQEVTATLKAEVMRAWPGAWGVGVDGRRQWW